MSKRVMATSLHPPTGGREKQSLIAFVGRETRDVRRAETIDDKTLDNETG